MTPSVISADIFRPGTGRCAFRGVMSEPPMVQVAEGWGSVRGFRAKESDTGLLGWPPEGSNSRGKLIDAGVEA